MEHPWSLGNALTPPAIRQIMVCPGQITASIRPESAEEVNLCPTLCIFIRLLMLEGLTLWSMVDQTLDTNLMVSPE